MKTKNGLHSKVGNYKHILKASLLFMLCISAQTLWAQQDTAAPLTPPDFNQPADDALKSKSQKPIKSSTADPLLLENGKNTNGDLDKARNEGKTKQSAKKNYSNQISKAHPDGVMMKEGKLIFYNMGRVSTVTQNMSINGMLVETNGKITKKNGSIVQLKQGQHINMSGTLIPMSPQEKKMNQISISALLYEKIRK